MVMYKALFRWRHLVGLVADHLPDVGGRDANVFADARLAKAFDDALTNGTRGKGQAINLHEERIFSGVCKLGAHLQNLDLQLGI